MAECSNGIGANPEWGKSNPAPENPTRVRHPSMSTRDGASHPPGLGFSHHRTPLYINPVHGLDGPTSPITNSASGTGVSGDRWR